MKPFKGHIQRWWIERFKKPEDWDGVPLHNDLVYVAYGFRENVQLMHTSPIVKWVEIPRHNNGDQREFEIETENSIYRLIGDPHIGYGFDAELKQ